MKFIVLKAESMNITVFRYVMPSSLVGRYGRYGGTFRLHAHLADGGSNLLRGTRLHSVTSLMMAIFEAILF